MEKRRTPAPTPNASTNGSTRSRNFESLKTFERKGTPDRKANKLIGYDEGRDLALEIGAVCYLECSAYNGDGVSEVFSEVVVAARALWAKNKKKKKSIRHSFMKPFQNLAMMVGGCCACSNRKTLSTDSERNMESPKNFSKLGDRFNSPTVIAKHTLKPDEKHLLQSAANGHDSV